MPRRIPSFPDYFHSWNYLSSIGSGITFLYLSFLYVYLLILYSLCLSFFIFDYYLSLFALLCSFPIIFLLLYDIMLIICFLCFYYLVSFMSFFFRNNLSISSYFHHLRNVDDRKVHISNITLQGLTGSKHRLFWSRLTCN